MRRMTGLALTSMAALFSLAAQADVQLDLGTTQRVTPLFAYPNNCTAVCFRPWTLEQTVAHYVNQSVLRDGYTNANVSVKTVNNEVLVNITGVPSTYGQPLLNLLTTGESALAGGNQLNGDKKWAYNWYLFLPLGMALENRKSIELMHFPPDYSLTQAQDYLYSKTTDRWASLLAANGIPDAQTPMYQTIVDIAPIAAPSDAGTALAGVYSYFNHYQTTMVQQTAITPNNTSLPMVAFGAPVRDWIKQQYGQTVGVLGLVTIQPTPGQNVYVLGSNHPSYIFYAADKATYGGDEAKADQVGLSVMGQDLTAACWQAQMGQNPSANPQATLASCTQSWQVTNKVQACELFFTSSLRHLTEVQAQAKCMTPPPMSAASKKTKPASKALAMPQSLPQPTKPFNDAR